MNDINKNIEQISDSSNIKDTENTEMLELLMWDGYEIKSWDLVWQLNHKDIWLLNLNKKAGFVKPWDKLTLENWVLYRTRWETRDMLWTVTSWFEYKREEKEANKWIITEKTQVETYSLNQLREKWVEESRDYIVVQLRWKWYKVKAGDFLSFLRSITYKNDQVKFIEDGASKIKPGDIIKIEWNDLLRIRKWEEVLKVWIIISWFEITQKQTEPVIIHEVTPSEEPKSKEELTQLDKIKEMIRSFDKTKENCISIEGKMKDALEDTLKLEKEVNSYVEPIRSNPDVIEDMEWNNIIDKYLVIFDQMMFIQDNLFPKNMENYKNLDTAFSRLGSKMAKKWLWYEAPAVEEETKPEEPKNISEEINPWNEKDVNFAATDTLDNLTRMLARLKEWKVKPNSNNTELYNNIFAKHKVDFVKLVLLYWDRIKPETADQITEKIAQITEFMTNAWEDSGLNPNARYITYS